jgi:hypothetical protein
VSRKPSIILTIFALFSAELIFLPMPGLQEDEMLFALPFLNHRPAQYHWGSAPVMLMDYIGALKTWIYWPIFHFLPIGAWSVRLPVCLLSLVTLWLFADLTRRVAGAQAALFAAAILATDAPFILTNAFDWGPVCLLLLSTLTLLNLLVRYAETRSPVQLATAFLIAGLATWYKAFFLVMPASLLCAWLVVYRSKLRNTITRKATATAILSFCIGAAPLIAFNIRSPLATLTASRYLPDIAAGEKLLMMARTLQGRSLEHYMFRSAPGETIQLTGAPIGDLARSWISTTNFHPGSALFGMLGLALLALFFLRESPRFRSLCVAWLAATITFVWMLFYRDAGAGPHHSVLLYPAPQFIVAVTAVALGERFSSRHLAAIVTAIVVLSNLWLLEQYARAGRENGFSVFWTDGSANLTRAVESDHLPIAFLDWGIENSVRALSENRLTIVDPAPPRNGVIYIAHCPGYVIDPSRSAKFGEVLSGARIIRDSHGNPVYCIAMLI